MKICRLCKKEKTFVMFYKNNQNKDGYMSMCIQCNKEEYLRRNSTNKFTDPITGNFHYKICKKHGPLNPEEIRITQTIDRGNKVLRLCCLICAEINKIDQCNEERKKQRLDCKTPLKCNTCKEIKDLNKFNKGELRIKGPRCKSCQRKTALNYESKVSISRKFKFTRLQYNEFWTKQKGLCLICNQPETSIDRGKIRSLAADHCHKIQKETGQTVVRGLLCTHCNNGLGRFKDDAKLLMKAAQYLDNFYENS